MSDHIGSGYGSEFHLMRVMGRYRNAFNKQVGEVVGGDVVEWLDMLPGGAYDPSNPAKVRLPDREYKGIEFLPEADRNRVMEKWRAFWPQSGNAHNWDAVGRVKIDGVDSWLLVEAKAHVGEMVSDCGASEPSLCQIRTALKQTQAWLGIEAAQDWCKRYYQAANRLAMLYFLNELCGIPTRMLFVYFCGDKNPREKCPTGPQGWSAAIEAQNRHLSVLEAVKRKAGCYDVFWSVNSGNANG